MHDTFGKLENGRAQAELQARPQTSAMASAWPPDFAPSSTQSGMSTSAATVWLKNVVAKAKIQMSTTASTPGPPPSSASLIGFVAAASNPLSSTAFPSAFPPPMRKRRCQL
mmetsp:Transcript_42091/g.76809  ORF Transcript_42091/g.76809 Transcript_42091/m.76809 type:complete len:111 (-) Transcript_42091:947-1279(-)